MGRNGDDGITARDEALDDENAPTGLGQPVSETEIEELLYNEQLSIADRLAQLRRYRAELAADENADFGGGDTAGLVQRIDDAISELESDEDSATGEVNFDSDPLEHRETLSPDDDDLLDLEALEEEDEDDLLALDGDIEDALDDEDD